MPWLARLSAWLIVVALACLAVLPLRLAALADFEAAQAPDIIRPEMGGPAFSGGPA